MFGHADARETAKAVVARECLKAEFPYRVSRTTRQCATARTSLRLRRTGKCSNSSNCEGNQRVTQPMMIRLRLSSRHGELLIKPDVRLDYWNGRNDLDLHERVLDL